ncbi:MAG: alpha/beta hydrolase [Janthinobacterium lividum]
MIGAPLFFIHGMWSTPAAFAGLRTRLELGGRTTVAPALPFHDRPPEAPAAAQLGTIGLEDYILFLVDEIARLPEKPIIAGHSMGGFLAQAVAARVGAPGLILFAPGAIAGTSLAAFAQLGTLMGVMRHWGWWEQPTKIDPAHARSGLYNEVPTAEADLQIASHVWDSGRVLFEMGFPWLTRTQATRVDYSRLTMPTLVIVGDHDRTTIPAIARATARRIAGPVDYNEIPAAGHWLWYGATEAQVGTIVERWLAALPD